MEQSNLPSDLRHVDHHVTRPILNLPVLDLSFSKKLKICLLLFLSSLVCIHLGYLRTDISGIIVSSRTHLAIIIISGH